MSIHLGANLTITSDRIGWDPNRGYTRTVTYSGTPEALLSQMNLLSTDGVACQYELDRGVAQLSATWPDTNDGTQGETPTDHYEISKDYVQESIWRAPFVWAAAASAASGSDTASDVVALWREACEFMLTAGAFPDDSEETAATRTASGGPRLPRLTGFTGSLLSIYKHLLEKEDSFDTERVVLTRVRTFSVRYAPQVSLEAAPIIYSTSALASPSYFGLPTSITSRLPATPATAPAETAWGWKRRQDRSQYTWGGRVEETMDWVFAPWSTLLYTHV